MYHISTWFTYLFMLFCPSSRKSPQCSRFRETVERSYSFPQRLAKFPKCPNMFIVPHVPKSLQMIPNVLDIWQNSSMFPKCSHMCTCGYCFKVFFKYSTGMMQSQRARLFRIDLFFAKGPGKGDTAQGAAKKEKNEQEQGNLEETQKRIKTKIKKTKKQTK